jgi:dUTP pyrophosphatase
MPTITTNAMLHAIAREGNACRGPIDPRIPCRFETDTVTRVRITMDAAQPTVRIQLLPEHPDVDNPEAAKFEPARDDDAGIDLIACESISLAPGERAAVSAGIRIALPPGVEGQIRPRSGRSFKEGLTVVNAPGTIDPGYRGPIKVLVLNAAAAIDPADLSGPPENLAARLTNGLQERSVQINRGERIAQLVFARFERPAIEITTHIDQDTARGAGGFGSTGVE